MAQIEAIVPAMTEPLSLPLDVTDRRRRYPRRSAPPSRSSRIDVLVNNVGIGYLAAS
jgi:hypothetical protein